MKVSNFSLTTRRTYEAPLVEIIEIEPQGVLCTSGLDDPTISSFTGDGGVHFGTIGGSW